MNRLGLIKKRRNLTRSGCLELQLQSLFITRSLSESSSNNNNNLITSRALFPFTDQQCLTTQKNYNIIQVCKLITCT